MIYLIKLFIILKEKKTQNSFFISLNQFVPNSNFSIRWSEYGLQMNVAC